MKKNLFSKAISLLLAGTMAFSLSACSSSTEKKEESLESVADGGEAASSETGEREVRGTEDGTRIVTDMSGYEVELPMEVNRVIDLWHANNQVVLLLGGADKLIGTTSVIKGLPWYAEVYPAIADVPAYSLKANDGTFNTEEILKADADVVITSSEADAEVLRAAGITTAVVNFRDFDGLKETVRKTAEILGGDAPERAEKYCAYFDDNMAYVTERLADLKEERPRVYEVRAEDPLQTDGKESICTEWIEAAGGVNVAAAITDENMSQVTLEELIAQDPEVIIVALQNVNPEKDKPNPIVEEIQNDPSWSSMTAVKNGAIYANPVGTFLWSRYSCEEALQILWTAQLLHPEQFEDLDMVETVRDFYKEFYDFDMTAEQAEDMLKGLNP